MAATSFRFPGCAAVFRPFSVLCLLILLAAACAQAPGGRQASCDDGGDGGVLIDGICL
jgi:hypothetical protein